jgi:ubiquitin-like 1-activating enzyme E1 A
MTSLISAKDSLIASSSSKPSSDQIYDRQIRLWGASSQSKILSSTVLILNMSPVLSEVSKNIVLAGVSVTVVDIGSSMVSEEDVLNNQLLYTADLETKATVGSLCRDRLQAMNIHGTVSYRAYPSLAAFLQSLAVLSNTPPTAIVTGNLSNPDISALQTSLPALTSLVVTDTFDMGGIAFQCLRNGENGSTGEYTFSYQKELGKDKKLSDTITTVYKPFTDVSNLADYAELKDRWGAVDASFVRWMCAISRPDYPHIQATDDEWCAHVKAFLKAKNLAEDFLGDDEVIKATNNLHKNYVPSVAAVLGGVIGTEVIKCLTGMGEPIQNFVCYDAEGGGCKGVAIPPIPK